MYPKCHNNRLVDRYLVMFYPILPGVLSQSIQVRELKEFEMRVGKREPEQSGKRVECDTFIYDESKLKIDVHASV